MSLHRDYEHPDFATEVEVVKHGVNLTVETGEGDDLKRTVLEFGQDAAILLARDILRFAGVASMSIGPLDKSGHFKWNLKYAAKHPFADIWTGTAKAEAQS